MYSKKTLGLILLLMLTTVLEMGSLLQPTDAAGEAIYIRADGSIDPPSAPIQRIGNVYTFTANISASIIVRKNNITIDGAGYTLQGPGIGRGIDMSNRTNSLVKRVEIRDFYVGIFLRSASNNSIVGNTITDNSESGIVIKESGARANVIHGNTISGNSNNGIYLFYSARDNRITANNITANTYGIRIEIWCSNNSICRNHVANNYRSIYFADSSSNLVCHNNFLDEVASYKSVNHWNCSYPSGGNYWSAYTDVDLNSDGIWDHPYVIDANNTDGYPLVKPIMFVHEIAVTDFKPCKQIVCQHCCLCFNSTLENQGYYTETFRLTIHLNTTAINETLITLVPEESYIHLFKWNATDHTRVRDGYVVDVVVEAVPSENDNDTSNNRKEAALNITKLGDINGDDKVDLKDVYAVQHAYGSNRGSDGLYWHVPPCIKPGNWSCPHSPNLDVWHDHKVELRDYYTVTRRYGKDP